MAESKIIQRDTTKESVKAYLDIIAEKDKIAWHSQEAHKKAVGVFCMDAAGITEPAERSAFMKQWLATPASFGANASAMGQQLGRPSASAKLTATFEGY